MQDKDIIAGPKILYYYKSIFILILNIKYTPIDLVNRVGY